jgi:hypothetical protein
LKESHPTRSIDKEDHSKEPKSAKVSLKDLGTGPSRGSTRTVGRKETEDEERIQSTLRGILRSDIAEGFQFGHGREELADR